VRLRAHLYRYVITASSLAFADDSTPLSWPHMPIVTLTHDTHAHPPNHPQEHSRSLDNPCPRRARARHPHMRLQHLRMCHGDLRAPSISTSMPDATLTPLTPTQDASTPMPTCMPSTPSPQCELEGSFSRGVRLRYVTAIPDISPSLTISSPCCHC
jgi:hypothetical protein